MPNWSGNKKVASYYKKTWLSVYTLIIILLLYLYSPFKETIIKTISNIVEFPTLILDLILVAILIFAILTIVKGLLSHYDEEQTVPKNSKNNENTPEDKINIEEIELEPKRIQALKVAERELYRQRTNLKEKLNSKATILDREVKDLEVEIKKMKHLLKEDQQNE